MAVRWVRPRFQLKRGIQDERVRATGPGPFLRVCCRPAPVRIERLGSTRPTFGGLPASTEQGVEDEATDGKTQHQEQPRKR